MGEDKEIKAVIWDLDNTLWEGILLESGVVSLKPGVVEVIQTLDQRGILHSIASRNDSGHAMARVKSANLAEYFLYPKIGWQAKSESIARIQKDLNLGMDTLLFIDDDPFERDEVKSVHPEVTCIDPADFDDDIRRLLDLPRLNPRFITPDSRRRRQMYLDDIKRTEAENTCQGPKEAFLAGLDMKFSIASAKEEDLQRAEELTNRTHQLNATGRTYSYDELNAFRLSASHQLLVCELIDRYGSYGKIGLALLEMKPGEWWIRLLLMSCRVMSRGVGTILLSHVLHGAKKQGVRLFADFVPTDRNRMMYVAYKFAGFAEIGQGADGLVLMENDFSNVQPFPGFMKVTAEEWQKSNALKSRR